MPRPSVETRNCRVTLSENQVEQVQALMEHLGLSTLSEGLRYLITRGIQSELVTLSSISSKNMSNDFARFVELMQKGYEMDIEAGEGK